MEEIKISFAGADDFDNVALLSKQFAAECCCNGVKAETENFYKDKTVLVASVDNLIVGYLYFEIKQETQIRPYAKEGDKVLWIEELFVLPTFRKNGVGKLLFDFAEKHAKENDCKTMRVNAVSKDYKRLLKFYIEKLDMDFWSALLIKNI